MTTFTLAQDAAYSKLVMVGNHINGQITGENTLGIQDAKYVWHPSDDEMAYRRWNQETGAAFSSFVWPTVYISGNDVGNGFHGPRLFDDAGNWLGAPGAPVVAPVAPVVVPAPVAASVAASAAPPVAPPVAAPAPKPAVVVHVPSPVAPVAAPVAVSKPVVFPPSEPYVAPKFGLWERISWWFRSLW